MASASGPPPPPPAKKAVSCPSLREAPEFFPPRARARARARKESTGASKKKNPCSHAWPNFATLPTFYSALANFKGEPYKFT